MTYPLAVQLYTLRHLSDDPRDLIRTVADVGYPGVEGGHYDDPDSVKAVLDETNTRMVSAHVGLDILENKLATAIEAQKVMGNDTIILPWFDGKSLSSAPEWQAFGKRLAGFAEQIKAEGLDFMYHNHSFEFAEYDGKLALEILLDNAPGVGLELDLGWCQEGGVDPLPLLEKYRGRVKRVHVKDRAAEGENTDQDGWADVGHGVMDYPPLLKAAKAAGAEWFVVEHDLPKDPAETIRRSYTYLSAL